MSTRGEQLQGSSLPTPSQCGFTMAGMSKTIQVRWIVFALAVPISLYVTFYGTIFMGFCPGIECWPHTIDGHCSRPACFSLSGHCVLRL